MTTEINSLKKERRDTTTKKDKEKAVAKKPAAKKTSAKKTKEQKKKTNDKWAWKGKSPKETDSKENNAFVKTFESKKYYGVITTIMGLACGPYITPMTVKRANPPQKPQPTLISQPLTLMTVIPTRNVCCTSSGCLSITPCGGGSPKKLGLILGILEPQASPPYVPKRKRKPLYGSHFLRALIMKCTGTIMVEIDNIKVRRHYRTPGLQYNCYRHRRKKRKPVPQTSLTGMTMTWDSRTSQAQGVFDSDAQTLMLDDGASACITNNMADFIEPPKRVDKKMKGIKGHAHATHRGTIKWHIEDDRGLVHVMIIRGTYLIQDAPTRILSPQHLAQQADDHYPREEGTGALTTSKTITLFWAQRHYAKTVPLDSKTNVGLTTTAAGARSFRAFCAHIKVPETVQPNIFTTHVIPDDDDESFQPKDPIILPNSDTEEMVDAPGKMEETMTQGQPQTTVVDLGPITHVIPEDDEPNSLDPHDELLRWHYRLGHLSFDHIRQLAHMGQLPKRLITCKKPFCTACQYGKLTKRRWRVKGDDKSAAKVATRPGQVVSVDQLESNTPGFIAQLKGKLTQQRYHYATVFVDQYSGYTFVYLQRRITSDETVQAKHAFERAAGQRGVKILHTTPTTGGSRTMPSSRTATPKGKVCHIVVSTPTSRMGLLRDGSGISKNKPRRACCTP